MFGVFRIFRRKTAFQLKCNHPLHPDLQNPETSCTKTCAFSKGGEAMAKRILKAWAIAGRTAGSKQGHKDMWEAVFASSLDGTLPSEAALEQLVWHAWADVDFGPVPDV